MPSLVNVCYLFVIFCVYSVSVTPNYTTVSYGEIYEDDANEIETSTETTSMEVEGNLGNLTTLLKMATLCETPNHDPGYCIEIKECTRLLNQLNNTNARDFLRESKCGPENENPVNPKVCCGKYDNYRNIVDDDKIFPKVCGQQNIMIRGRIIGGKEALLGEYPWMARLIHKNKYGYKSFGCSGFLIHVKYVVTAAHCTHSDLVQIRGPVYSVVLGEHNTETTIDCSPRGLLCAEPRQISRAAKVITHSGYNPNSNGHYNDIAIIHLKKGARISSYVQPICLLTDETQIPSSYYLSGWGKTEKASSSKIKMKAEIPAFDKKECKDKYKFLNIKLKDTQICAGGDERDSCTGDSGGPLMMPTSNGTWYAAGIVSYGIGCATKGWPGVYTNIVKFLPWIKSQIVLNGMVSARSNFKKGKKHRKKVKVNQTKDSNSSPK